MAYKILLLKRGGLSPLWSPYMIEKKIMQDDPSGAVDIEGKPIQIEAIQMVEFETDVLETLDSEVEKILETYPKKDIRPICDLTFTIDALINHT